MVGDLRRYCVDGMLFPLSEHVVRACGLQSEQSVDPYDARSLVGASEVKHKDGGQPRLEILMLGSSGFGHISGTLPGRDKSMTLSQPNPLESNQNRPENKSERVERCAGDSLRGDGANKEDREALNQRGLEEKKVDEITRSKTPEEVTAGAKRGQIKETLGDASKALGFSLGLKLTNEDGSEKVILPGRSQQEVEALKQVKQDAYRTKTGDDPDMPVGKAKDVTEQDIQQLGKQL